MEGGANNIDALSMKTEAHPSARYGTDFPTAPALTGGDSAPWPRPMTTRNGAPYRIRPIRADDLERDRQFIKSLSESARYNRLMGVVREPSPEQLDEWVHVDYERAMALVAVVGEGAQESIIGVARYAGSRTCCEFAVAVADAWQSHGIGTQVSELLFEYAKAHGVVRMCAVVFADNARMLKLASDLNMSIRRFAHDTTLVEAWRTL